MAYIVMALHSFCTPFFFYCQDVDNNLIELHKMSQASAQRLVELASEWEKHRVPLVNDIREKKGKVQATRP